MTYIYPVSVYEYLPLSAVCLGSYHPSLQCNAWVASCHPPPSQSATRPQRNHIKMRLSSSGVNDCGDNPLARAPAPEEGVEHPSRQHGDLFPQVSTFQLRRSTTSSCFCRRGAEHAALDASHTERHGRIRWEPVSLHLRELPTRQAKPNQSLTGFRWLSSDPITLPVRPLERTPGRGCARTLEQNQAQSVQHVARQFSNTSSLLLNYLKRLYVQRPTDYALQLAAAQICGQGPNLRLE